MARLIDLAALTNLLIAKSPPGVVPNLAHPHTEGTSSHGRRKSLRSACLDIRDRVCILESSSGV